MEATLTQKHKVIKDLVSICFLNVNNNLISQGLSFKYKSESFEDEGNKYWRFIVSCNELGYGEREVQEFRLPRPSNIDSKSMELHMFTEVLIQLSLNGLVTWYEMGKMLNTDKDLQKQAKDSLN